MRALTINKPHLLILCQKMGYEYIKLGTEYIYTVVGDNVYIVSSNYLRESDTVLDENTFLKILIDYQVKNKKLNINFNFKL